MSAYRKSKHGDALNELLIEIPTWKNCFVLIFLSILFSGSAKAQQAETILSVQENIAVPEQFSSLYKELDESITKTSTLYPFTKGKYCPLLAPELFMAGSGFASTTFDSQRWKDILTTVDAFRAMGMNAVSVMIASPDLTIGDTTVLIGFYQHLAAEIHLRGMKLYIEHFDNPPFSPHAHKTWQNTEQGRKDFLLMREKELTMIYRKIKPDYLSMITEPGTLIRWSHLSFSVNELSTWIAEVTTRLKATGASPNTLLGAGAGSWESESFVTKFAEKANLDYIDIHVYALKSSPGDNVARFDTIIHKIREIKPLMNITIGETWLFKHSVNEAKPNYSETFFMDNFSFWSPLDQMFLKLLMGVAQKENISVVVPYFSQYFFTYYTFGDAESSKLAQWPASVFSSWSKAIESIQANQYSSTGKEMSLMLKK